MKKITAILATSINAYSKGIYSYAILTEGSEERHYKTETLKLHDFGESFFKDQVACHELLEYHAMTKILQESPLGSEILLFSQSLTFIEIGQYIDQNILPRFSQRQADIFSTFCQSLNNRSLNSRYLSPNDTQYQREWNHILRLNLQADTQG